jgi:hypothetical protein
VYGFKGGIDTDEGAEGGGRPKCPYAWASVMGVCCRSCVGAGGAGGGRDKFAGGGVDDGLIAEGTSETLFGCGGGSSFNNDMMLDVLGFDEAADGGATGGVCWAGGVRLYSGRMPISLPGRDKVERGLGGAGDEGCISVKMPPRPGGC